MSLKIEKDILNHLSKDDWPKSERLHDTKKNFASSNVDKIKQITSYVIGE